jgi:uncharacterized Zn-binding protein involved in type VI secretion
MPSAARVSDVHTCPASSGPVAHVGGPILPPGSPNVLTNSLPQARVTDRAMCFVGPPDVIVAGSSTVLINNLMAARITDLTMHGGIITGGSPNVEIGGPAGEPVLGNPTARNSGGPDNVS